MANDGNLGPLGSDTNRPTIDAGTNCLTNCPPPGGQQGPQMWAGEPPSTLDKMLDWGSELNEAAGMLVWWVLGSPSFGGKSGDLEFGPEDSETRHLRNTPAYTEAVEIYQEWVAMGRPPGQYQKSNISCEWVPSKGHFFVQGRTGGGTNNRPGKLSEPLAHPLWGYTGNFSIRFKEAYALGPGYVQVEMENYTSLPSYLHGVTDDSPFLDSLYTRQSGWSIVSRSRQVYRFITYIPVTEAQAQVATPVPLTGTTHVVVGGDSLSGLAQKYYGDMSLWPILFNRNRAVIGADFNRLSIGQTLTIPPRSSLGEAELAEARALSQRIFHTRPVPVAPLR